MKHALIALVLAGATLTGCAAQGGARKAPVCPQPRDIGTDESLKHYTIHVLNLYNMCRDVTMGKRDDIPTTDTVQDSAPDDKDAK